MSLPTTTTGPTRRRATPALAAAATAAAVLTACGGGGSDGNAALAAFALAAPAPSASAPTAAPASDSTATSGTSGTDAQDLSSTPCVNPADFSPGTTIAFSAATSSPVTGKAPFQRKTTTGARESFANVSPVPFAMDPTVQKQVMMPTGSTISYTFTTTENRKEYRDLVAGQVVIYGEAQTSDMVFTTDAPNSTASSSGYTTTRVFDPALSVPVTMQPGTTITQRTTRTETTTYRATGIYVPAPATSTGTSGLFSLTYQGRERLTTTLGTYDTCRFTYQMTTTKSGISVQTTQEHWVAAEGPYRGQMLRLKKNGAVWDVTTLTYSPS
ncbi:hypothetical protein [uncultured Pseudacidovorax sp.]|uniref:hypothetical protein n=1 Tax=uncultured Pseudacidovorax sp. TaxID=679313 RepID=UPI0025DF9D61|nr:hypothetical protein [uncultured Pseudacidovorax sp.]